MGDGIIFMGSPDFAIPVLKVLAQEYRVAGVITQPDKPAGRGRILTPPPIKELAIELGIPYIQPRRLRDPEAMQWLGSLHPDLIVVAAFGQILRSDVLDLPVHGCINVHASLLPRWRGAAPIQAAILNGDTNTGVTIMLMDAGIDTGPILNQRTTSIEPEETAEHLTVRLSRIGAALLLETIPGFLDGRIIPKNQEENLATLAPMIKKEAGEINFNQPAEYLARQVRAYYPWPGTFIYWQEQVFKILRAHHAPQIQVNPGQKYVLAGLPALGTIDGLLVLDLVQPAGKKAMPGEVFIRGAHNWA
jgi:methionyl-tRNA formyltransferase